MSNTNVRQIDKDGVWIVNLSEYRYAHGMREGVYFESKQPTRIKMDDWIKGQHPMLQEIEDPFSGELPPSPVVNETPLKDVESGEPVTGVGTGPAGTGNGDDVRQAKAGKK